MSCTNEQGRLLCSPRFIYKLLNGQRQAINEVEIEYLPFIHRESASRGFAANFR